MTLEQFHAATGADVTLIAADTDSKRMLWLNHRTAPNCPVKYAARMSMSVPLLWEEVKWQETWDPYLAWNPKAQRLEEQDLTGHAIVDGGLVSNFPIALFLAARDDVTAVVGPPRSKNVLGFLIDETLPVVAPAAPAEALAEKIDVGSMQTVQRFSRLVNTATSAHDNMAIAAFAPHVVRLPAAGYDTTQFDMTDEQRDTLVAAGRQAMQDFLKQQVVLEGTDQDAIFAASDTARSLANQAAATILGR
jgi:predicted acylesterase/phospholipase RssA